MPKLWVKERGRPGRKSSDSPSSPCERMICVSSLFATHNFGTHGPAEDLSFPP